MWLVKHGRASMEGTCTNITYSGASAFKLNPFQVGG